MATKPKKSSILELATTAVKEARSGAFSSDPEVRKNRKPAKRSPDDAPIGAGMAAKAAGDLKSRRRLMDVVDEMETGKKKR